MFTVRGLVWNGISTVFTSAFSRLGIKPINLEVLTEKLISMLFGDGGSVLAVTEARGRH